MAKRQIRIKDIAVRAGVSPGTVDRVLHNRGEVSEDSKSKVEEALKEMDYRPNLYASALAFKRKEYRVAYMIPMHQADDYWADVERGIRMALADMVSFNLELMPYYFDQFDTKSFNDVAKEVCQEYVNGVIFSPMFEELSQELIKELKQRDIPFVLVDSMIETPHMVSYFGQDSLRSGYQAGQIVESHLSEGDEIVVFHSRRSGGGWSTQSNLRKNGFLQSIHDSQKEIRVNTFELPIQDEEEARLCIKQALLKWPNTRCAMIFNSRGYLIGEVLEELDRKDIVLVGFDVLSRNVTCLKNGSINFLIGQHPHLQGYRSVKTLCEAVILKQQVRRINYMPIDILSPHNIEFYTGFDFI